MAITAVNQFAPEWYTLEKERKADKPAKFKLTGLNGEQQAELTPEIILSGDMFEFGPGALRLFMQYGVLDWENVTSLDGAPVAYPPPGESVQAYLPYAVQAELARRLFDLTFVTHADKKKSSSPPK